MPSANGDEVNLENKKSTSPSRKLRKQHIALVLIITSLVLSPVLYSWVTSGPEYVQTMVFVLKSDDTDWLVGEGRIWSEEYSEILTPFPPMPLNDLDSDLQIGWYAWMPVDHIFQEPILCNFEYTCSALNMTVGPISFLSNYIGILYHDASGRIIEQAGGYLGKE